MYTYEFSKSLYDCSIELAIREIWSGLGKPNKVEVKREF